MQKAHDSTKNNFWRNLPEITTPITKDELNRMETSMDTIDDRVISLDLSKADEADLLTCVSGIALNTTTGILTVSFKNGTTATIDTGLAKLAINFDYDDDPTSPHYQQIVMEMKDGTYKYIDLSALITQYEFIDSSTIHAIVGQDGTISFEVINGSITEAKLQPNFLADIKVEVTKAETAATNSANSATSSANSALDAEAWAKGTRNNVDVPATDPTFNKHSKYWAQQAENTADYVEEMKEQVQHMVDTVTFNVDFTTGHLMYSDDSVFLFNINQTTGNLDWEVVTA